MCAMLHAPESVKKKIIICILVTAQLSGKMLIGVYMDYKNSSKLRFSDGWLIVIIQTCI